jgi:prophage antirepressor-like protein
MSKTSKSKRKIINLDDPDLEFDINTEDFDSEFMKESKKTQKKKIKQRAVKSVKNIINKFADEEIEINNNDDPDEIKNIFEYEGNNILVIVDKEGKPWTRAKDITGILEYGNGRDAMKKLVNKKYKKSYADIGVAQSDPSIKIDPQTIFIDRSGILRLVAKSTMPKAMEFFDWIADEVIPNLLEYGTYTIKSPKTELSKLTKDFYEDNDITDFENTHVFYLAYIDSINGQHILKFGVSGDYPRRELEEHRKTYKKYNVIKIWPANANYLIETKVKKAMRAKRVLHKGGIKGTELISLNGVFTLDKCIETINKIAQNTKSKLEEDYEKSKNEIELLKKKLEISEKANKKEIIPKIKK